MDEQRPAKHAFPVGSRVRLRVPHVGDDRKTYTCGVVTDHGLHGFTRKPAHVVAIAETDPEQFGDRLLSLSAEELEPWIQNDE